MNRPPILVRVLVAPGVVEYHAMEFPHRALDGDAPTPVMVDPLCVPAGLFEEGLDPEYIRCITDEPLDIRGLGRWFDEWRQWLEACDGR